MRTIKRYWREIVLVALLALCATPAFAFNSSFGYAAFLQLIGNNAQAQPGTNITTQMTPPVITTASTTGALTQGPLFLEVVATSTTGTSSPSAEYATTTSNNEGITLTWPQVPGASGYLIYISTTTSGNEQGYFLSTTTSQFTLNSTTSPIVGTPLSLGAGFYAALGSGSSSLTTAGPIQASSNATTTNCTTSLDGAQFFNTSNAHLWLCTGAGPTWTLLK